MVSSLARSYLFVPADAQERLGKATSRGADAVIADLEDSVAPARKGFATRNAAAWTRGTDLPRHVERWVRVNLADQGLRDIADVFSPHLTGICLPKASEPDYLRRVCDLLDDLERTQNVTAPPVAVMPLIESASGVKALHEIASSPRVHRLQLGEIDLAADLGLHPGDDEAELASIRSATVVASAAAGLLPPVGAVSPDFRNLERLVVTTERLRRAGFIGRAAIHPAQLEVINKTFSVTPAALAGARRALQQYETALASGNGAIVGEDGRMVDEAVIKQHHRTIALASAPERE